MTGERVLTTRQPGDRAPAPGQLALVQAFVNTHYDLEIEPGAELLATPEKLGRWLARTGLAGEPARADQSDLERALIVREGLRALAREQASPVDVTERLNRAGLGASVEVRFDARGGAARGQGAGGQEAGGIGFGGRGAGGIRFVAAREAGVAGAIGVLLAVTAQAMADGSWSRLKICPGDHCGWAFYDHSRNRSGRWCAMSICGGRAKARSHYRRRRSRDF